MTKKKSVLSNNFWSDFSKIYKNPSLVNQYLIENSDSIEKIVINNFKELKLIKNIPYMLMVALVKKKCSYLLMLIFQ